MARVEILTQFPPYATQINSKKKPASAIYDTPTAQRKVIDQRVIAGPSKTSHQQGNK
jgi:hypothetical protein